MLNDETDQVGMVDFAWSHAIISDQLHRRVKRQCDFSSENQTIRCNYALSTFLQAYSDIDIYSIYSPVCVATLTKSSLYSTPRIVASPRAFSKHVSVVLTSLSFSQIWVFDLSAHNHFKYPQK